MTVQGKLKLKRPGYYLDKKDKGSNSKKCGILYPLDKSLAIDKLPLKMTIPAILKVVKVATETDNFNAAARSLKKCGMNISTSSIKKAVSIVGKFVEENDFRKAHNDCLRDKTLINKIQPKDKESHAFYVKVCREDNVGINLKKEDSVGFSIMHAVVFSSKSVIWATHGGSHIPYLGKREHLAVLEQAGQSDLNFKTLLKHLAVKNSFCECEKIYFFSDGSLLMHKLKEELFPSAIELMDLDFLREIIISYLERYFTGTGINFDRIQRDIFLHLQSGDFEKAYSLIRRIGLRNSPKKERLIKLLKESEPYIPHGHLLDDNVLSLPFKLAIPLQFELKGMLTVPSKSWSQEMAQHMLTLKAKRSSGLWEEEVVGPFLDSYHIDRKIVQNLEL
ncbi:MAG: hypothetical protein LBE38_04115 [Deltaproteobacteria bacterium]|jgi:hypothetical protein|nr:hypothetical protein [Deltaproteobacteria bacterium]